VAAVTVRPSVLVLVRLPEVPEMVTVAVPVVAALPAVSVNVLEVVAGLGLKMAITPLGRPEADKVTAPLKPLCGVMVTVLDRLVPWVILRLDGDADRLKLGAAVTVSVSVMVLVKVPEVPEMVTVAVPVVAVVVAVSVSVLVVVAGFIPNDAVTPLGRSDADKVTAPVNPLRSLTVIVLELLAPCTKVRLPGDADNVKFGEAVTVNVTGLLSSMPGPTETTKGPEVAPVGIVMVIDVGLQALTVTREPLSVTMLLPCDAPNPDPEIMAWLPAIPVLGETLVMTGAGFPDELIETLSKVAVASVELLSPLTARPTYTPVAMVTV